MGFGCLCFSHPQASPIESVPVRAPNPYQVGVIRRDRQEPQVQTYLEEKVQRWGAWSCGGEPWAGILRPGAGGEARGLSLPVSGGSLIPSK